MNDCTSSLTKRRRAGRLARESGQSVRVAGGKMTDSQSNHYMHRDLLVRSVNKRLDFVHFHYTLLDKCAEFSFVYGNNQQSTYAFVQKNST